MYPQDIIIIFNVAGVSRSQVDPHLLFSPCSPTKNKRVGFLSAGSRI